jgi:hypothetical protein
MTPPNLNGVILSSPMPVEVVAEEEVQVVEAILANPSSWVEDVEKISYYP